MRRVRGRPGAAAGLPRDARPRASSRRCCPRAQRAAAFERIREIEVADVDDIVVLPGAAEPARARSPTGGVPTAIVTSGTRDLAEARIAATGLTHPPVVVTASDVERGKPWPDPWLEGARRLGVDPADCVVVEDAVAGLRAARAAGCRALVAVLGTTPREELAPLADLVRAGPVAPGRPRCEGGRAVGGRGIGSAHGCRRRRRGCRPRRSRRHVRARRRRPVGGAARPGERGQPRRPGVVELRRPVPRRQPRAAPDGHLRLLRARLAGLGGHRRLGPPDRRPTAAPGPDHWGRQWGRAYVEWAAGEKRAWLQRARHLVLPRRRLGRARRRHQRRARQLGAALPHPVGHRHRRRRAVRAQGARAHRRRAGLLPAPPPGRPARAHQRRRHRGARRRCSRRTTRPGASRATARSSASSSTAARRSSSPPVASAATTTSCGPTGPSGSAPRRRTCSPGCRPTSTAGCSPSPRRPAASIVNRDRMWHYVEGVRNWDPIWPGHAIRILPGPSSMWFDARGNRLPAPYFPGFDTLGTLDHLRHTGFDHSWFILNRSLAGKEFALSGSEQNLDLTEKRYRDVLRRPVTKVHPVGAGVPRPRRGLAHRRHHRRARREDERADARGAAARPGVHRAAGRRARPAGRQRVHQGRPGRGDPGGPALPRRQASPSGPSRCTASSTRSTARSSRCGCGCCPARRSAACTPTCPAGCSGRRASPVPGLYAAGEVAGFGGGGVHGYRALEGTFVGGCLFSGRAAGRAAASAL